MFDFQFFSHPSTGQVIFVCLFCFSVLGFAVVLDRLWFWSESRSVKPEMIERVTRSVIEGNHGEQESALRAITHPIGVRISEGISGDGMNAAALRKASEELIAESERGLGILSVCYSIAPMFGILGTVTGIMKSFSVFSAQNLSPEMIVPGIAEALMTTAVGLCVAIPAYIFYFYFSSKTDRLALRLEQMAALTDSSQQKPEFHAA